MYGNLAHSKVPYLHAKLTPLNARFVTLTFKEPIKAKKAFFSTIISIVNYLNKCGEFHLASEIGDNGKFHYHYIIKLKDPIKHNVFINYWESNYGMTKNKVCDNWLGSFIYIREDSNEMVNYLFPEQYNSPYLKIITNSTIKLLLSTIQNITKSTKQYNKCEQTKGSIDKYYKL